MCTHIQRHTRAHTYSHSVWHAAYGNEWVTGWWTDRDERHALHKQVTCKETTLINNGAVNVTPEEEERPFSAEKCQKENPDITPQHPAACGVLLMANVERETRHIHTHMKPFSYCRILAEEKSMGSAWSFRSGGPQISSRGDSGIHKNMYVFYLHLNSSRFCSPSTSLTGC